MRVTCKLDFIRSVKQFNISTEYAIIKPNWITDRKGEYTEPELLEWLLEALPDQKKIIVESYTPWRGYIYISKSEDDELKVDLVGGKAYWDFYKEMDLDYLARTGIGDILNRYNAVYINITDHFWSGNCIEKSVIQHEIEQQGYTFHHPEIAGFMPVKLYELKERATLINLSKIKRQKYYPEVGFGGAIKNLFGLLPHPSRSIFHPNNDFTNLGPALADIFFMYALIFKEALWIAEGIKTIGKELYTPVRSVEEGKGVLFAGRDPFKVDQDVCGILGVNPLLSKYYLYIKQIENELHVFS